MTVSMKKTSADATRLVFLKLKRRPAGVDMEVEITAAMAKAVVQSPMRDWGRDLDSRLANEQGELSLAFFYKAVAANLGGRAEGLYTFTARVEGVYSKAFLERWAVDLQAKLRNIYAEFCTELVVSLEMSGVLKE